MNAPVRPLPLPMTLRARKMARRAGRQLRHLGNNAADWWARDELVLAERTPYAEIFREDITAVRHYLPLEETEILVAGERVPVSSDTHAIPLVLVAPLAATMRIYDLFPDRSLVKYLRARGFNVYLVDWGRPEARHDELTLADFFAGILPRALAAVRQHSGSQKLSLHGWSFGAMFSTCYAALGDSDIENLVLVGAPCDYHASGELGKQYQRLAKQLRLLKRTTGFSVRKLPPRLLRAPGWANSLMFKLASPAATLQGYAQLLRNLHDREFVAAHATNAAFLDDMTGYPGAVVQDILEYLWTENCLPRGQLPMRDRRVTFADVQANVLSVAGTDDFIVTVDATKPLMNLIGSKDKTLITAPGGHMGILGGSRAPETIWKPVADWLAARSG